jgi:hypothetical protein
MSLSSASFLVKCGAVVACVSIVAGCAPSSSSTGSSESGPSASETPIAIDGDDYRLVADESASPELQGFLDTWNKDGVTIAETPATDDEQLVAFTDDNGNGVPDEGEPVLAQAEGGVSDIPQLAVSQSSSGVVTGRCFTNSYQVNTGTYSYRGKSFDISYLGWAHMGGGGGCQLSISLNSEPFPGEKWEGLIKGTYRNEPYFGGWFIWPSTTSVSIEIPLSTNEDILDDAWGRDGELAIVSKSEDNPEQYPENRMIVGSWRSEVIIDGN